MSEEATDPETYNETIEKLRHELREERQKRRHFEDLAATHAHRPPPTPDSISSLNTALSCFSANTILAVVGKRTTVLVILLLLQSISSSVLMRFEELIAKNTIIPLFLTMLVGAGGNAGNQATVRSISGLTSEEYKAKDFFQVVKREATIGCISATCLTFIGFFRVYIFAAAPSRFTSLMPVYCISLSLFLIVVTSCVIGSALPFILEMLGLDREHAGPAIQVIMDIFGVLITCITAQAMLAD